jgi:hypothetical protein
LKEKQDKREKECKLQINPFFIEKIKTLFTDFSIIDVKVLGSLGLG